MTTSSCSSEVLQILLDLQGVAAVVEVDGIGEDGFCKRCLSRCLRPPWSGSGTGSSTRDLGPHREPDVGKQRGDPLRRRGPRIFRVDVRGFADGALPA